MKRTLSQSGPPDAMRRAAAEQTVMIVRGAHFESVAIFGFVLAPRGALASQMIPFAVVSLHAAGALLPHPPNASPSRLKTDAGED